MVTNTNLVVTPRFMATLGSLGVALVASCWLRPTSGLAGHCSKMFVKSMRGFYIRHLSNGRGGSSNVKRWTNVHHRDGYPSYILHPTKYLKQEHEVNNTNKTHDNNLAIIVLNKDIDSLSLVCHLWKQAAVKICADGGANRLYDAHLSDDTRDQYIPNCIIGDLDSVRPDVLSYYKSQGAQVIQVLDQSRSDCDKAVSEAFRRLDENQDTNVVAVGCFGGRFDHEMSVVNSLFKYLDSISNMVLIGDRNTATLLRPGRNVIYCDKQLDGPICGLLPIGGSCTVTTRGLKWDLYNQRIAFGELVSSSNRIFADKVSLLKPLRQRISPHPAKRREMKYTKQPS